MADGDALVAQIEQNIKWLYAANNEEYKDQFNEAMESIGVEPNYNLFVFVLYSDAFDS